MTIDWHFPRTALARQYIDEFDSGLSDIVALFAPRRMGKTEFVMRDVIPIAKREHYTVVVIDFWNDRGNPARCIITGIDEALAALPFKRQARAFKPAKITAEVGTAGGKISGEFSPAGHADVLEAFTALRRAHTDTRGQPNGRILLFLDEVQHLATESAFENITATLRTFIDKNRNFVKVIMTGSSQDNLQRMFQRSNAPFYNMTQTRNFPELDMTFVQHMLDCYRQATGKKIRQPEAVAMFRRQGRSPYQFHGLIKYMAINAITDLQEGWSKVEDEITNTVQYPTLWNQFKFSDQLVLKLINNPAIVGVYSQKAMAFIGNELGVDNPNQGIVQHALARLRAQNILCNRGHGQWEFEDPGFAKWISENT
jgi:uncharacterized protein